MNFRKFISIWALLALMVGQIALAHHSASHIEHGFSQEVVASYDGHDEHQHDEDTKKHECPECLLNQSLQAAFYNAPASFSNISQASDLLPAQQNLTIVSKRHSAHSPRAPPTILI